MYFCSGFLQKLRYRCRRSASRDRELGLRCRRGGLVDRGNKTDHARWHARSHPRIRNYGRTARRAPVGCVRLHRIDETTWGFGMLAAAHSARGTGIGRRLVASAEAAAREASASEMQLELLVPISSAQKSKVVLAKLVHPCRLPQSIEQTNRAGLPTARRFFSNRVGRRVGREPQGRTRAEHWPHLRRSAALAAG